MKARSVFATFLTLIGALCIGLSLYFTELFPAAEEFSELPLWLKIVMIGGAALSLLGLVLSFVLKNRSNTFKFALIPEGIALVAGIACAACCLLREESAFKTNAVSVAPVLLAAGALCFLSTLIGICRKGK